MAPFPDTLFSDITRQLHEAGPVSPDAISYLMQLFRPMTLHKGEYLVRANELQPCFGFLVSGLMRHYFLRSDGTEITVDFARPTDLVGEYNNLLLGQPANHFVQALESCQIAAAPIITFRESFSQFPDLERISRQFSERYLHRILTQLSEYMVRSAEERYVYLLTHEPDLIQRVPQVILASYVGVTPVSLSRIRRRLTQNAAGSFLNKR